MPAVITVKKDPDGYLLTLPNGDIHQADDDVEARRIIARWVKHHGPVTVKGRFAGTKKED